MSAAYSIDANSPTVRLSPGFFILACMILALAGCDSKGTQSVKNDPNQPGISATQTDQQPPANQVQEPPKATDPADSEPGNLDPSGKTASTGVTETEGPDESATAPPVHESVPANYFKVAENQDDSPLADIPLPKQGEPADELSYEDPQGYVEKHTIDIPKSWTRVSKEQELWVDIKNKTVIAGGYICLRRGGLEMFICPMHTKEHESVIAVNAASSEIHRAFLALGANPGSPVQWHPEYKPAFGPKVEVNVWWKEADKIVKRNGKQMVRHFETKKPLETDWVFGGSRIHKDPVDGYEVYFADGGELVCLSNFSTAAMDLPIASSDSNDDLLYEAFTEKIPPRGTKVYVLFKPEIKKKESEQPTNSADDKPPAATEADKTDAKAKSGDEKSSSDNDDKRKDSTKSGSGDAQSSGTDKD